MAFVDHRLLFELAEEQGAFSITKQHLSLFFLFEATLYSSMLTLSLAWTRQFLKLKDQTKVRSKRKEK